MESGTATTLATAITDIGSVITGFGGWLGNLAKMVFQEPVLLIPYSIGIAFLAIVGFKKLAR